MDSVPLTLDTLQPSPTESPLMSPHKAMSAGLTSTISQANERPSHLTLDGPPHSNVSPSSSSLSAHGNISPGLSSAGSLSPSFLPEMPQWKRDLIQRRKQNVQRTINASSPNATAAAATSSPLSSPSPSSAVLAHGLKTSTSSSSMRSLAGSNTNIDQVASDGLQYSPTKDFNKLSSAAGATTAKVNKHHATTATATATGMPATIKATLTTASPNKEKSEKLFGGQYTATAAEAEAAAAAAAAATVNTKEEITKDHHHNNHLQQQQQTQQQQQHHPHHYQQRHTMEEEYLEKSKKTKEYHTTTTTAAAATSTSTSTSTSTAATRTIKTQHQEEEQKQERQEEEEDIRHITTSIKPQQPQQQQQHKMATRLTGSSSSSSSSSHTTNSNTVSSTTTTSAILNKTITRESISSPSSSYGAEREQQHVGFSITGANSGSSIQSSSKCESERLVCAANIAGSNTATTVKISQKLQQNQFIKNEQQHKTKIIKFKSSSANTPTTDLLKSPTKIAATATATASASFSPSSSSSSIAITTNNCLINNSSNIKKMVAMQEMKKSSQNSATSHLHSINSSSCGSNGRSNRIGGGGGGGGVGASSQNSNNLDSNEDLSYGPGIVSKLRCRYLSLALRESMEQQRLNKDQLRRSTSLNNLLDDDCVDHGEDDEDNETLGEEEDLGEPQKISANLIQKKSGILKTSCNSSSVSSTQEKRFTQGSNGVGVTFTETSFNKRSRHLKRGNDSLKRARSVEALLSEKSPWQPAGNRNSAMPTCVTIEDKIHNARERMQQGTDHMPPKRLTSIIDDTERPPPDLVKQTLKMFEASANRRPRCTNRSNSKGDVASKVETFKNIIKDQKPVVTYPKPSSPTKKLNTPPLVKPLKSTTQASDLLQTPLGRKTLAVASSNSSNTLSDLTPDIIPRQKLHTEREMSKEKLTGINKEKFMNSLMEPPLSTTNVVDSPLKSNMKEKFLGCMVDSPVTALTKELEKMNLHDIDNAANRKGDNFARNGGGGGGVGGVDGVDDALHDNDRYNSKNEEMNTNEFSSLKSENDKISETTLNSNAVAAASIASQAYEATAKAHSAPSSSDLSDGEDDDEYGISTTKRITRSALDNIAKAGTTQQFKFSTTTSSSSSSSSHHHSSSTSSSSSPALVGGKQIGVIRPLLNTSSTTTTSFSTAATQKLVTESNMETLKQHSSPSSLTSREIEKNRINDLKKSSTSSPACSPAGPSATSSPSTASLDNVIKSSTAASAASGGYSDVDTVISATNSPLWAMRKRRQNPPAQPAENTSMVFNFSNRKAVPDYIENDGVIYRRKRELPKPNESGFVLLGDLSVETSTDMDYDDFSMCPPSPCDVEFVNANIVIDGKSSIRQKSKDATFRVQFNDTLTSTFEYPSEASLVVEDSFADYAESEFNQALQNLVLESYASSSSHHHRVDDEDDDDDDDDDDDSNAIKPSVHHVADEIIQLPTTNESSSSSPANQQTTKNILGNLPLDYPDLGKATPLTVVAAETDNSNTITTQENNNKHNNNLATQNQFSNNNNSNILNNNNNNNNNILNSNNNNNSCSTTTHSTELPKPLETRKSRKDLKLPLLEHLRQQPPPPSLPPTRLPKPQLPMKRCQMVAHKPLYLKANPNCQVIDSNDLNIAAPTPAEVTVVQQHLEPVPQQQQFKEIQAETQGLHENYSDANSKTDNLSDFDLETMHMPHTRKVSHVLNKPQYACFLQPSSSDVKPRIPAYLSPVQRSRSNEFQRTFCGSNFVTTSVFRSSSLRNIDKPRGGTTSFSLSRVNATPTSMPTTTTTTNVITTSLYFTPDVNLTGNLTHSDAANNPANILCTAEAKKSKSLNNLTDDLTENCITNCYLTEKTNVNSNAMESRDKNTQIITATDRNILQLSHLTDNSITLTDNSGQVPHDSNHFSHNFVNTTSQDIRGQQYYYTSCSTTDMVLEHPRVAVKQQISYSTANLTECCNDDILENTTLSLPNLTEISNAIKEEVTDYFAETQLSNVNNNFSDYSVKITEPTTLSLPNLTRTITTAEKQKSYLHISYLNTNLTEYTVNITEQMTLSLPNLNQTAEELTDQLCETCENNNISVDLGGMANFTYNPMEMTEKDESRQSVNNINVCKKQNVESLNMESDTFGSVDVNISKPLQCPTDLIKNSNGSETVTDTGTVNDGVTQLFPENVTESSHFKSDLTEYSKATGTVNTGITELFPTSLTESFQSLTDLTQHSVNIMSKIETVKNIKNPLESTAILKYNNNLSGLPVPLRECPKLSLHLSVDSLDEFNDVAIEPMETEDNYEISQDLNENSEELINQMEINMKFAEINRNSGEIFKTPPEKYIQDKNVDSYDLVINELPTESTINSYKKQSLEINDNKIELFSETPNSQLILSTKSVGSEASRRCSLGYEQTTQCYSENKKISLDISNHFQDSNKSQNTINTNEDKNIKIYILDSKESAGAKSPLNSLDSETVAVQKSKSHKIKSSVNLANITLKKVGGMSKSTCRDKSPEIPIKSPRIPKLKPTNRLAHLRDTKSIDVATYLYERANSDEASSKSTLDSESKPTNVNTTATTFRRGHKCNRNISSSFRQALTLYESFNENSKDAISGEGKNISGLQRSKSLIESHKLSNKNDPLEICQNVTDETKLELGCPQESPYYSLSDNSLEYYDTLPLDDTGNANVLITLESDCQTKSENRLASHDEHSSSAAIKPLPLAAFNTSPRPFRKLHDIKVNKEMQKSSFLAPVSGNLDVNNYQTTSPYDSPTHNKISNLLPLGYRTCSSGSPKTTSSTALAVSINKAGPPVPQKPTCSKPLDSETTDPIFTSMSLKHSDSFEFIPSSSSSSSSSILNKPCFSKIPSDHEVSSNLPQTAVVIDSETSHSKASTASYKLSSTNIRSPMSLATSSPNFLKFSNEFQKDFSTANSASTSVLTSSPSFLKYSNEYQNDFTNASSASSETFTTFGSISRKPREFNGPEEIDLNVSRLGCKATNSSYKPYSSANSTASVSTPCFVNSSQKFHVGIPNPPDIACELHVSPGKLSKPSLVASENATYMPLSSSFKISPSDSQMITTSKQITSQASMLGCKPTYSNYNLLPSSISAASFSTPSFGKNSEKFHVDVPNPRGLPFNLEVSSGKISKGSLVDPKHANSMPISSSFKISPTDSHIIPTSNQIPTQAAALACNPANSSYKFLSSSNSRASFSIPPVDNSSEKFHVDIPNPSALPLKLDVPSRKTLKVSFIDSESATSVFKISPTVSQITTTSTEIIPFNSETKANVWGTPEHDYQPLVFKTPSLECKQTSSNITAGQSCDLNSPTAGNWVPYSNHTYPKTQPSFSRNLEGQLVDMNASNYAISAMPPNFPSPESQNLKISDNIPLALNTLSAKSKPLLITSNMSDTTITSFALPTQMGTEHTATQTLNTLPVKVTSTSQTRENNYNNNNAFASTTNNHKDQVKGKGGFTSKPMEFLKTAISCSSTFSSPSCSYSSSTLYSTTTTTTTTSTATATAKRMPQRGVFLQTASAPKVMPRRIFAAPLPTVPSQKTKTTSKNTAITTGTIKTMTATSITSNYSSSSSPSCSAPLGFYTPMKAPIERLFQLGVTRAPNMCPSDSTTATMNGDGGGKLLNGKGGEGGSNLIGDNVDDNNDYSVGVGGEQEPESLQYIKPADGDLNIAYSEGTQKTDLLY